VLQGHGGFLGRAAALADLLTVSIVNGGAGCGDPRRGIVRPKLCVAQYLLKSRMIPGYCGLVQRSEL
jgi:hypothetical protein